MLTIAMITAAICNKFNLTKPHSWSSRSYNTMSRKYIFAVSNILVLLRCVSGTVIEDDILHRSKRQLLFPNSTLLQFNVGIGTPSPAALINVNWAFQANFNLPWNRTQIPIDILDANNGIQGPSRRKRENVEIGDYENDSRLYHFYKYVEGVLDSFGHKGTTCVLRALCQIGAEPLHSSDDDLFHEIAAFVLNPKNDLEHPHYIEEIHPYVEAYSRGEALDDCANIYKPCPVSLIDLFTKVHTDH